MAGDPILFERRGRAGLITLNRPQVLNALDLAMLRPLRATLRDWAGDPEIGVVILRGAGERAFCAGGDVVAVRDRRGDAAFMDEVYRVEYEVDDLLHTFPRPVVPLMHGIVMGGGCGLSVHASHRVVSDSTVLATPETAIGLFPDVAASRFLAGCPGAVGFYLGLTGTRIGAADALWCGLADSYVPEDRWPALVDALAAGTDVDAAIAAAGQGARPERPAMLPALAEAIDETFSAASPLDILERLARRTDDWARATAERLRALCPFSLAVTMRAIAEAPGRTVAEVLATDFRIVQRLMLRDDYFEGVRARLVDKDDRPRWQPDRLELVDPAAVAACFAPLPGRELWPAT